SPRDGDATAQERLRFRMNTNQMTFATSPAWVLGVVPQRASSACFLRRGRAGLQAGVRPTPPPICRFERIPAPVYVGTGVPARPGRAKLGSAFDAPRRAHHHPQLRYPYRGSLPGPHRSMKISTLAYLLTMGMFGMFA